MVLAIPRTRAATIVGSLLRTGFRQIGHESVATMRLAPSPAERARRLDGGVERRIERRPERALATSVEPQMEGDPVRGHEHGCPDLPPRVAGRSTHAEGCRRKALPLEQRESGADDCVACASDVPLAEPGPSHEHMVTELPVDINAKWQLCLKSTAG